MDSKIYLEQNHSLDSDGRDSNSNDHRTPSCDSAQDLLYNQQSYTATITNNQQ